jgi:hypothetical protein
MNISTDLLHKVVLGENGCWTLPGKLQKDGYKQVRANGATYLAHRYFYVEFRGPIGKGLVLDHICHNRPCINPDHLEPITQRENCLRGNGTVHYLEKTACPQGHPYDGDNLYITPQGWRGCQECRRQASRRAYLARQHPR